MEVPEQSGPCYISNANESTPKEHTTFGSLATGAYLRLLENIYIEDRNTFLIVLCASFIFCESFLNIYIFLCVCVCVFLSQLLVKKTEANLGTLRNCPLMLLGLCCRSEESMRRS